MPTIGVILSKVEGGETKYCVVVKRWYPFKRKNYWTLEKGDTRINLTEKDLEEAFKEFTKGREDILYTNVGEVETTGVEIGGTVVNVSINRGAFDYKYGFPKGGKEDKDADDKACALRELKEETGIILNPSKLVKLSESYDGVIYYKATFEGDETSNAPLDGHEHEIFKVLWLTQKELNYIIKNEPTKCPRQFKRYINYNLGERNAEEKKPGEKIVSTPLTPDLLGEFSKFLPQGVLERTQKEAVAIGETELKKRISKAIKKQRQKPYHGGGETRKNRKTRKNRRNNKSRKNKKSRRNSYKSTKRR
jgi:hypothetical protein